jgi:hypothetical protein
MSLDDLFNSWNIVDIWHSILLTNKLFTNHMMTEVVVEVMIVMNNGLSITMTEVVVIMKHGTSVTMVKVMIFMDHWLNVTMVKVVVVMVEVVFFTKETAEETALLYISWSDSISLSHIWNLTLDYVLGSLDFDDLWWAWDGSDNAHWWLGNLCNNALGWLWDLDTNFSWWNWDIVHDTTWSNWDF